jgi:SPP1 family predicted phage head-tail adaptor
MRGAPTSGEMQQRITIQRPDGPGATVSPSRQVIPDWVDYATVWAKVEPIAGREVWYGHQVQADITHGVLIRYDIGALSSGALWRIIHRGRVLNIKAVRDLDEREWFLAVLCVEQVGGV